MAVRERLVADVPLGLFLSGGIDSSYVLAQMIAAGAPRGRIFAIGFSEARYDERAHAAEVAGMLGSDHHEAIVEPTDLVQMLPTLVHHYGEPFADPSMVPTFYLCDGRAADHRGAHRRRRRRVVRRLLPSSGRQHGRIRGPCSVGCSPTLAGAAGRFGGQAAHPMSARHKLYRFLRAVELGPRERYAEWTAVLSRMSGRAVARSPPRPRRSTPRAMPERRWIARWRSIWPFVARPAAAQDGHRHDGQLARGPRAITRLRLVEWAARLPTASSSGAYPQTPDHGCAGSPSAGALQAPEDGFHRADSGLAARRL